MGRQALVVQAAAVAGDVLFQFRYATDGGVNEPGAFLDNISIKVGQDVVVTDGAENGDNGGRSTAGRPRPEPR